MRNLALVSLLTLMPAGVPPAQAQPAPEIFFGPIALRPLPDALKPTTDGRWTVHQVNQHLVASLDDHTGRLVTWDGEKVAEDRSFAPMPFEPHVFAYDPTGPRLAIARMPAGLESGPSSQVAIWYDGAWHSHPDPKAKIHQLFWLSGRLHASVEPCRDKACSNRLSFNDIFYLPKRLVVWKATAPATTRWDEIASTAIPAQWHKDLARFAPQSPWSTGPRSLQRRPGKGRQPPIVSFLTGVEMARSAAIGFLAPTASGRVWFVSRGPGETQLRDGSGAILATYPISGIPERFLRLSVPPPGTATSCSLSDRFAVRAVSTHGEDLLALVTLDTGPALVRVSPGGEVASCSLPADSRPHKLLMAGSRALLVADWHAILEDSSADHD